ncbi:MAG: alpha/beta hydrolase [Clostridium perfringens]|nr:alpha/beta hydrolase [Clostridium perfringens]
MNKKSKVVKNSLLSLVLVLIISFIVFFIWAKFTYKPTSIAVNAMVSNELVNVTKDEFIVFTPNNITEAKGLIFYPGAKVEPESYTTLCKEIAKEGFLVVIAPMPLDLAILSPNKAESIIDKFDNIETWAIGGHSLGGVMASNYGMKNDRIKGIIFYASYPQGDKLKNSDKKVLSIYGSLDGVANLENIKNASLPDDAKFIEIEGGNHSQFGSYGEQSKDNKATISEDEQIHLAAKYTVELLNSL